MLLFISQIIWIREVVWWKVLFNAVLIMTFGNVYPFISFFISFINFTEKMQNTKIRVILRKHKHTQKK